MTAESIERLEQEIERLRRENHELRQQLMQAQKMSSVGALAASITHEFNNILTTIINYAKMGLRHKDVSTREKAFDKILTAGQRASKITTGMLAYARHQGQRRDPTDLVSLVEGGAGADRKGPADAPRAAADGFRRPPFRRHQCQPDSAGLLNLLVNARQAMDNGGTLHLSVRPNDESGHGRDLRARHRMWHPGGEARQIFEPFYTTKEADSQGQGGTGLGLALCRDIIEAHKGRIRVESTVGKGTTFTLKLALASAPAPCAGHSASRRAGRQSRLKLRALVNSRRADSSEPDDRPAVPATSSSPGSAWASPLSAGDRF